VEVSSLARSLSRLTSDEPVRQDLIDRVRSEIESGSYETPEKIDGAVDGLLRELGG
jgi:anti-sigma28 factor (negative regulator of flagellin synthesis)